MIINFTIENSRSIKEEISFSMAAESSKSKEENVFVQPLSNGNDEVRLLKTALVYGANASGKTNLFRSLFDIIHFIGKSNINVGEDISIYNPFKFDTHSKTKSTKFSIDFIGKDGVKYSYSLDYNKKEILNENLIYYPLGREKLLFSRIKTEDKKIDSIKPGADLHKKKLEVFNNQAILSKFGREVPHEIISEVFLYITSIEIINACNSRKVSLLKNEISKDIMENKQLNKRINELISFSDTGISSIRVLEKDEQNFKFPDDMPDSIKDKILNDFKYNVTGVHPLFDENNKFLHDEGLSLDEESHGTKTLFSLGGKILQTIESGSILFIDEIDTGLHPFLSKLIVALFQNKRINSKNAQLVFTTHDTNLLDRTLFRKDQIWFAEKSEFGITDIYSLQDFNEVREDTPFDKWYMAGKFGGVPNIQSLETLFSEDEIQ